MNKEGKHREYINGKWVDFIVNKFTSEELTELEDIVRKSIELHEHTFGVEPRERGSYLEKMKEIKAFTEQENLLKSLHLKDQSMCIELNN